MSVQLVIYCLAYHLSRLHYKYLARRVVAHWKHVARDRINAVRARRHAASRSLVRAWRAWCEYHTQRKRAQRNEIVALIQYKYSVQRASWRRWRLCVLKHRVSDTLWSFAIRQGNT